MAQSAEHIAADKDHKPVWEGDEIYNCSICGLAVMSDGRNHGFDSDYDVQEEPMSQSKSEPFQITTIITFDDQDEPQAVTVENFGGMPRSAVRAICEEALDRFYGASHDYRVQLSPVEPFELADDVTVFEVYKRFVPPSQRNK